MHHDDDQLGAPSRPALRRWWAALRSSVRRYPGHLLASVRAGLDDETGEHRPLLEELARHEFGVCWLGHASVALHAGDRTMVVDPVLSRRIGPRVRSRTIGLERMEAAPVAPGALRGVDVVLITHAHFDHLDRPTLEAMADERTTVVVPSRCAKLVPGGFGDVVEMAAGDERAFGGVSVAVHTPEHWGARTVLDRARGFNAYEVRHESASALLAGDTAFTTRFDALEGIDLAVFGVGAYEPWEHMHATPEQVWRMFTRLGATALLPVHHSTFELSDEAHDEPMRRLYEAAGSMASCVVDPTAGEVVDLTGRVRREAG